MYGGVVEEKTLSDADGTNWKSTHAYKGFSAGSQHRHTLFKVSEEIMGVGGGGEDQLIKVKNTRLFIFVLQDLDASVI